MPLTQPQLLRILPNARPVAGVFVPALNRAMARFDIGSPVRQAAFLAQVGHESGHLTKLSESLYYKDAERVAQLFKYGFDLNRNGRVDAAEIEDAKAYLRNSQKLANRVYADRMGNGPEASGDGYRYRARGAIGITGRDMYRLCGQALGLPLVEQPELLEQPEFAALSAAWFWWDRGLNELADAGLFDRITRVINAKNAQQRLADRLATADVRLSVLLAAGAGGAGRDKLSAAASAGSVVHGGARAELDPAHAQRIIGITDTGDRGLIALAACQAYAKEVSTK